MFALACFIGIYSYGVFALGISCILTKINILAFSFSWFLILIIYLFKYNLESTISNFKLNKYSWLLLSLLITQLLVNLVGALGPELGFDALWYHLTQPKIWLQEGLIRFIPGPVFRYSVTPQLTETLYAAALAFSNEIWAKIIHFSFGILSLVITYKISKKLLPDAYCLFPPLILSSNLVFSWLQTTAYIDLTRTFFESLALFLFLEEKYTPCAITLGLAVCTKLVSIVSLPIFIFLLILNKSFLKTGLQFTAYSLLIPLPWFLFAFIQTGNPFYPVGSLDLAMPLSWNPADLWTLFSRSADPVSPIYIITVPLIFFSGFKKWGRGEQIITAYVLIAIFFWFLFPHTGGSRYFLPYLPALSVLIIVIFLNLKDHLIKKSLIFLTLTLTLTSIVYRAVANLRYLPVILGYQTRSDFLAKNLNFSFGDFYDTDNYLSRHLSPAASIYPIGINNLYYINYRIITPQGDSPIADYLLLRRPDSGYLPDAKWQPVHYNPLTKTTLYGLK